MTTTDAPTTSTSTTTTGGRVSIVSEPSVPADGQPEGTPADRDERWSRSPWSTAGEWVDRYFGCVSVTLELTRQLALSWTEPVGWPPGANREQPDTDGDRPLPKQRPTVTASAAATRDADTRQPVAGDRVARTRRTRAGRARQPHGDVTTTGQGDRLPAPGRSGTGFVDGLIGHLMDRDITGSLGIDR